MRRPPVGGEDLLAQLGLGRGEHRVRALVGDQQVEAQPGQLEEPALGVVGADDQRYRVGAARGEGVERGLREQVAVHHGGGEQHAGRVVGGGAEPARGGEELLGGGAS